VGGFGGVWWVKVCGGFKKGMVALSAVAPVMTRMRETRKKSVIKPIPGGVCCEGKMMAGGKKVLWTPIRIGRWKCPHAYREKRLAKHHGRGYYPHQAQESGREGLFSGWEKKKGGTIYS